MKAELEVAKEFIKVLGINDSAKNDEVEKDIQNHILNLKTNYDNIYFKNN